MTSREDGYTLVEALVSLAILSGAIVIAFNILATSLRGIKRVETEQRVLAAVEDEFVTLRMQRTLKREEIAGRTGETAWKIVVTPLLADGAEPDLRVRPFRITATVDGKETANPQVILETILLARDQP